MTGAPFPSSPSAGSGPGPAADGSPGDRRPTGRLIVQATLAAGLVAALSLVGGSGLLTRHEAHVTPVRAVAVAAPVTTPVRWQPQRTASGHHRPARRLVHRAPAGPAPAPVAVAQAPATAAPSARATTMAQAAPPPPPSPSDADVRSQPVQRSEPTPRPAPKSPPKPAPRKPASSSNGGWASDFNP